MAMADECAQFVGHFCNEISLPSELEVHLCYLLETEKIILARDLFARGLAAGFLEAHSRFLTLLDRFEIQFSLNVLFAGQSSEAGIILKGMALFCFSPCID